MTIPKGQFKCICGTKDVHSQACSDAYLAWALMPNVTINLRNGNRIAIYGSDSAFIADRITNLITEGKL